MISSKNLMLTGIMSCILYFRIHSTTDIELIYNVFLLFFLFLLFFCLFRQISIVKCTFWRLCKPQIFGLSKVTQSSYTYMQFIDEIHVYIIVIIYMIIFYQLILYILPLLVLISYIQYPSYVLNKMVML